MLKGTKLYSIFKMKCPRCQEGDFFEAHPYKLSIMGKVKTRYEKCNQKFELETGFYQGSYYVSYGLGVALFIAMVILNVIFRDSLSPGLLMLSFVISLILLLPALYALSKIIWANLFIKYDRSFCDSPLIPSKNDTRA